MGAVGAVDRRADTHRCVVPPIGCHALANLKEEHMRTFAGPHDDAAQVRRLLDDPALLVRTSNAAAATAHSWGEAAAAVELCSMVRTHVMRQQRLDKPGCYTGQSRNDTIIEVWLLVDMALTWRTSPLVNL
eukprot:363221-Chlamydomonas_euryale.AAC.22